MARSFVKLYNFTLFEVLIAITVIAICFVVILNALSLNIQNTAVSNGYITACFLTNSKLAELLSQNNFIEEDQTQESDSDGDFGEDYGGYTWKLKVKNLLNSDNEKSDLYQVNLMTFFEEGNSKRQISVETVVYLSKKKNDDKAETKAKK